MTAQEVQIGQQWQDLDPRMPGRQVRIMALVLMNGVATVEYKYHGRTCRSEKQRFLKTFKLI